MALAIIQLAIMIALLVCALVLIWYAQKIHATHEREMVLFDNQDLHDRRMRVEANKARALWKKDLNNWFSDTRAILGKLHTIAAESSPHARDTQLTPPPDAKLLNAASSSPNTEEAEAENGRDSDAETRCMDKSLVSASLAAAHAPASAPDTTPQAGVNPASRQRVSPRGVATGPHRAVPPPASAEVLPSAPARVAAGLGPRPSSDARSTSRPAGTMLSMQAVLDLGTAHASTSRRPPPVELKSVCPACENGFVGIGNGGIGKCNGCKGTGFIDAT